MRSCGRLEEFAATCFELLCGELVLSAIELVNKWVERPGQILAPRSAKVLALDLPDHGTRQLLEDAVERRLILGHTNPTGHRTRGTPETLVREIRVRAEQQRCENDYEGPWKGPFADLLPVAAVEDDQRDDRAYRAQDSPCDA